MVNRKAEYTDITKSPEERARALLQHITPDDK